MRRPAAFPRALLTLLCAASGAASAADGPAWTSAELVDSFSSSVLRTGVYISAPYPYAACLGRGESLGRQDLEDLGIRGLPEHCTLSLMADRTSSNHEVEPTGVEIRNFIQTALAKSFNPMKKGLKSKLQLLPGEPGGVLHYITTDSDAMTGRLVERMEVFARETPEGLWGVASLIRSKESLSACRSPELDSLLAEMGNRLTVGEPPSEGSLPTTRQPRHKALPLVPVELVDGKGIRSGWKVSLPTRNAAKQFPYSALVVARNLTAAPGVRCTMPADCFQELAYDFVPAAGPIRNGPRLPDTVGEIGFDLASSVATGTLRGFPTFRFKLEGPETDPIAKALYHADAVTKEIFAVDLGGCTLKLLLKAGPACATKPYEELFNQVADSLVPVDKEEPQAAPPAAAAACAPTWRQTERRHKLSLAMRRVYQAMADHSMGTLLQDREKKDTAFSAFKEAARLAQDADMAAGRELEKVVMPAFTEVPPWEQEKKRPKKSGKPKKGAAEPKGEIIPVSGMNDARLSIANGLISEAFKDLDAALVSYNSAVKAAPMLSLGFEYRGKLEVELGDCAAALRDLRRAISLNRAFEPDARYYLGRCSP